ncbi:ABC transporter permease [Streptomyces graminilatus]|uniref:ABC transporter permease n=1 Tax=Streptomyces graminilatus TaxID=1464070 RepID=UPI00099F137D|nr:ABC transporter permease [Streptomyces graminilatus]
MTSTSATSGTARWTRPWPRLPVLRVIARSVLGAAATVLAASFLIYAALSLTPGDPVDQIVGQRATPEQRAAARAQLGLDEPLPVRYVHWVTDAVQGDLGRSITYRQDVTGLVEPRIATTLTLVALAAVIIVVFGIALGAFGGMSDRWRPVVSAFVGVGLSVPAFVSATVLIGVFAVKLGWFPTFGAGDGFVDRLHHLLLPAIALSLGWTAYVAQMTTAAVREQAGKDHVTTAVGRGLGRGLVFRRHILRNAALPVMTASGLTVAGLVAGSVIVETAFSVDGIGSLLMKSVTNKDYPVVMAISMLIVVIFVVVTTLLDLAQTVLDPRTRTTGGRK